MRGAIDAGHSVAGSIQLVMLRTTTRVRPWCVSGIHLHGSTTRRAVVVGCVFLALAVSVAAGPDAPAPYTADCLRWQRLASVIDLFTVDGWLWIVGDDGVVYRRSLRDGAPVTLGEKPDDGWQALPLPRALTPSRIAVTRDGVAYVAARRAARAKFTVLRRSAYDEQWEELPIPCLGTLRSVSIQQDGTVWVAGERREVFRLQGTEWIREVTPLPYHNERIQMGDDGGGWILGSTRSMTAIFYRGAEGWVTVAHAGENEYGAILYADENEIIVHGRTGAERFGRPGGAPRSSIAGFPGYNGSAAILEDPDRGWVIEDGILSRFEHGSWNELPVRVPFRPRRLHHTRDGDLLAIDSEADLWLLRACAPGEEPAPPIPAFDVVQHAHWQQGKRIYGIAVLTLAGRPHFYLVDHEDVNPTLEVVFGTPSKTEPYSHQWQSLVNRLRNQDRRRNEFGNFTYDTTALTADLDGDADEELIVIHMYDSNRLMRNVDDRRFVDWSRESGIGGAVLDHSTGGCLLDADGDGDLDLYVSNFLTDDRLHLNNGAAVFSEVAIASGIRTGDSSAVPACADLDADGDTDVIVPTWGRGLLLHENLGTDDGEPRFKTHRLLTDGEDPGTGAALSESHLNSVALADLDTDGLPEIFVATQVGPDRLFSNLGSLAFEEDLSRLPAGQSETYTMGANFFDWDHDGDLDLALTGAGGSRFYVNAGVAFEWREPENWSEFAGRNHPRTIGSVVLDFEGDGDLDLVHSGDLTATTFFRNRQDDDRSISVVVTGPPGNRSAVGARVALYPTGQTDRPDALLGWRQVPGGSGYGSHDSKWVHFGGLEPGGLFDLVVDLPGARTETITGVRAPHRGSIDLATGGVAGLLGGPGYRARHFFGDRWHQVWLGLTFVAAALAALAQFILFRGLHKPQSAWTIVALVPASSLVLLIFLPFDPGLPVVGAATGGSLALATLALAYVRSRVRLRPVPEVLTELNFSLRTFRHNQTPQRVLNRLQFVLSNIGPAARGLTRKQAELLLEDLRSYREVVFPELVSLTRLATALGMDDPRGSRAVDRQRDLLPSMVRDLERRSEERADPVEAIQKFRSTLEEIEEWIRGARDETDRRLAIDLSGALSRYVASRRPVTTCAIELTDEIGRALSVRFLLPEFYRVLDILLENAVKAMSGAREQNVRIELGWDGDRRARLLFSDTGPGIDRESVETVFDMGISSGRGGHGYGLYYARRTVQRFGGALGVESRSEPGACFRLELEAIPPASAQGAA